MTNQANVTGNGGVSSIEGCPEVYENYDLDNLVTPVNPDMLEKLLVESNYDCSETKFLINGFRNSFDIQYQGNQNRQSRAKNLPFSIGNRTVLWNKIMKEVKLKRVAGPYKSIPFQNYIQSPIGLVPKAGGTKLDSFSIYHTTLATKER